MTRHVKSFYMALIGTLAAIVALGEKIEALVNSSIWIGLYAIIDLFKYEILWILLLLLFWSPIQQIVKNAVADLKKWREGTAEVRHGVAFTLCVVIGLTATGSYQGFKYVHGKKILLTNYDRALVSRAGSAFESGNAYRAQIHLSACSKVLRSKRCTEILSDLRDRMNNATRLRSYFRIMSKDNPAKLTLLKEIYRLDRDSAYFNSAVQVYSAEIERIHQTYVSALRQIVAGRYADALAPLTEVQKSFPGYGQAQVLLEELRVRAKMRGVGDETPYLLALIRYGVDDFALATVQETDYPSVAEFDPETESWDRDPYSAAYQ